MRRDRELLVGGGSYKAGSPLRPRTAGLSRSTPRQLGLGWERQGLPFPDAPDGEETYCNCTFDATLSLATVNPPVPRVGAIGPRRFSPAAETGSPSARVPSRPTVPNARAACAFARSRSVHRDCLLGADVGGFQVGAGLHSPRVRLAHDAPSMLPRNFIFPVRNRRGKNCWTTRPDYHVATSRGRRGRSATNRDHAADQPLDYAHR